MGFEKPKSDGHFVLRPCGGCKSDDVGYLCTVTGGTVQYAAKCRGCGQRTPMYKCKHDAQEDWNGRFAERRGNGQS